MKSLIVAVLFGLCSTFVQADPSDRPTLIEELFQKAIQYGGYENACANRDKCPMPVVLIVKFDDPNLGGQFSPREPNFVQIAVTARPGSLEFNKTLVHEFVHYLQWVTGELGPHTRCSELMKIEEPAYAAASKYLAEFGIAEKFEDQLFTVAVIASTCEMSGDY